MILTVLALGGTILGATTIAGLLMLYQLRQTTDMANSARAIFAADAGTEKAFYDLFCANDSSKLPCPSPDLTFQNGASVQIVCYDGSGNIISPCPDKSGTPVKRIRTLGHAGDSYRAFEVNF